MSKRTPWKMAAVAVVLGVSVSTTSVAAADPPASKPVVVLPAPPSQPALDNAWKKAIRAAVEAFEKLSTVRATAPSKQLVEAKPSRPEIWTTVRATDTPQKTPVVYPAPVRTEAVGSTTDTRGENAQLLGVHVQMPWKVP